MSLFNKPWNEYTQFFNSYNFYIEYWASKHYKQFQGDDDYITQWPEHWKGPGLHFYLNGQYAMNYTELIQCDLDEYLEELKSAIFNKLKKDIKLNDVNPESICTTIRNFLSAKYESILLTEQVLLHEGKEYKPTFYLDKYNLKLNSVLHKKDLEEISDNHYIPLIGKIFYWLKESLANFMIELEEFISENGIIIVKEDKPTQLENKIELRDRIKSFKWLNNKGINKDMFYLHILLEQYGIIEQHSENLFLLKKAFSGEVLLSPLNIKWIIKGKNQHTSKPSLFYFIEELEQNELIERVYDLEDNTPLYKKIQMIFVDHEGNAFTNLSVSRSAGTTSSPAKESEIKTIIKQLLNQRE